MRFIQRRYKNIGLMLIATLVAGMLINSHTAMLHHPQWMSGWLLVGAVTILVLYSIRKKLSMIPLGNASTWLQLHLYLGFLSAYLFGNHLSWSMPNGLLEGALALLFVSVILTGLLGFYLIRRLPRELAQRGEEVIFERIPRFRTALRKEVEDIVLRAAVDTGSSTLADYYASRLALFFQGPQNIVRHALHIGNPTAKITNDIRSQYRYLNALEREHADQILKLVEQKDSLDFHYALQGALKAWLFLHVPLTYSLLIVALAHIGLVYAFGLF